ncbi:MAG TPA: CPBP family glutamic-type intramembrane protease [Terracidiphilus sp.]|jgi:hypothetical protein|nr:CPBP family glutamic-type intramembrane protease [Terracidiphilus sp.]
MIDQPEQQLPSDLTPATEAEHAHAPSSLLPAQPEALSEPDPLSQPNHLSGPDQLPEPDHLSGNAPFPEPNQLSPLDPLTPVLHADGAPLFEHYMQAPQDRIPHLGHLALLALIALAGFAVVAIAAQIAVMRHLFGVTSLMDAATNVRYLLGTQALLYVFTYLGSVVVFPLVWHKSLLEGLQWRGSRALQYGGYLMGAAAICFVLAMIDGYFFPGPNDAPIDRIFRMPGAAWILFAFGVTFAPFFEELAFRGFLLPALATSFDWMAEKVNHRPRPALDHNGHPLWSIPAMVVASLITSLFFALMHADQTSYSLGPFLLLIVVSLVLCTARLRLRSLAASVLLHATYNFLLFSFMMISTGGFRHLDKM